MHIRDHDQRLPRSSARPEQARQSETSNSYQDDDANNTIPDGARRQGYPATRRRPRGSESLISPVSAADDTSQLRLIRRATEAFRSIRWAMAADQSSSSTVARPPPSPVHGRLSTALHSAVSRNLQANLMMVRRLLAVEDESQEHNEADRQRGEHAGSSDAVLNNSSGTPTRGQGGSRRLEEREREANRSAGIENSNAWRLEPPGAAQILGVITIPGATQRRGNPLSDPSQESDDVVMSSSDGSDPTENHTSNLQVPSSGSTPNATVAALSLAAMAAAWEIEGFRPVNVLNATGARDLQSPFINGNRSSLSGDRVDPHGSNLRFPPVAVFGANETSRNSSNNPRARNQNQNDDSFRRVSRNQARRGSDPFLTGGRQGTLRRVASSRNSSTGENATRADRSRYLDVSVEGPIRGYGPHPLLLPSSRSGSGITRLLESETARNQGRGARFSSMATSSSSHSSSEVGVPPTSSSTPLVPPLLSSFPGWRSPAGPARRPESNDACITFEKEYLSLPPTPSPASTSMAANSVRRGSHERESELPFSVHYSDGGEYFPELGVYNLLENNRLVYSTVTKRNVNVMLQYCGPGSCVISSIFIKAPHVGLTSPAKDGLIFVSHCPIDIDATTVFDNFTQEKYGRYLRATAPFDAHPVGYDPTQSGVARPVAYFCLCQSRRYEAHLRLPNVSGRYVLFKFLRGHGGRNRNIDVQFVACLGFAGAMGWAGGSLR